MFCKGLALCALTGFFCLVLPPTGKCHCDEGWVAEDGACVPDTLCENIRCKENSICRSGRCYCNVGYMVDDNDCIFDPCAGVQCVDHAVCDPSVGKCRCVPPFKQYGASCVTEVRFCSRATTALFRSGQPIHAFSRCPRHAQSCLGVTCRKNSFCQKGLCYCTVGYHPQVDTCIKGQCLPRGP